MSFTLEQRKEAYRKLPPEVQDFIMSNDTTELITQLLGNAGLSGQQADSADSEVLYLMHGLQSLSDTMRNIAKTSGKDESAFAQLKTELNNKLLSKIPKGNENKGGQPNIVEPKSEPQVKPYDSFEQTILRQAMAMKPIQSAGTNTVSPQKPIETKQNVTSNDPYREPIE